MGGAEEGIARAQRSSGGLRRRAVAAAVILHRLPRSYAPSTTQEPQNNGNTLPGCRSLQQATAGWIQGKEVNTRQRRAREAAKAAGSGAGGAVVGAQSCQSDAAVVI